MPQAILIDRLIRPDPNATAWKFVLWADVPLARQIRYARPNATSAWKEITPQELADLRAGVFTEKVIVIEIEPIDFATAFVNARQEAVIQMNQFQAFITNNNPWLRTGTRYVGSGPWSIATNG